MNRTKELKDKLFEKAWSKSGSYLIELEDVYEVIDQFEIEQANSQAVTLPDFIVEHLEAEKKNGESLRATMKMGLTEKVDDWFFSNYENQEAFALAWITGNYEVEKEKRYRLVFPHTHNELDYAYLRKDGGFCHSNMLEYADTFTEAEIKEIDERYWAFAQEVTE